MKIPTPPSDILPKYSIRWIKSITKIKILLFVISIISIYSVYYVPMIEYSVSIQRLFFNIEVISDRSSLYEIYDNLKSEESNTKTLEASIVTYTLGCVFCILSTLTSRSRIFISGVLLSVLLELTGILLLLYSFKNSEDTVGIENIQVDVGLEIGFFVLITTPVITLIVLFVDQLLKRI